MARSNGGAKAGGARGDGPRIRAHLTVEVVLGDDQGRLGELLAAVDARPEFLGPPVGAEVGRRVIGVTVMVKARTERAAQQIATVALLDEMQKLGLVDD